MDKIKKIQNILMEQLERLDNDELMEKKGALEVARSNALTQTANTVIKSANLQLRIIEVAEKNQMLVHALKEDIGTK